MAMPNKKGKKKKNKEKKQFVKNLKGSVANFTFFLLNFKFAHT